MSSRLIFHALDAVDLSSGPVHLAIGMFDGIHLGHQSVIESAIHSARRSNGLAGVLTFWPHPSRLFCPDEPTPQIMDSEDKIAFLFEMGVDFVIIHPFDAQFSGLEAAEFLAYVKARVDGLVSIYVGENWRFGRGRTGDVTLLIELARTQGLTVLSAPRIKLNGEPISSTRVRNHLVKGEVEEANELLGHCFFSVGTVIPGRGLARTHGFPTLNLEWRAEIHPAYGVYAVRVRAPGGGETRDGIANFGVRPTLGIDGLKPQLEVHLLADCPWDTGDRLRVEWVGFIRGEHRFDGLEALRTQIASDIEEAISRLGNV